MQLISELRKELLAPVVTCRDAILSTGGNISQAYDLIVCRLTDDLSNRTGVSREEALLMLKQTGWDVERAFYLWQRDHSPLRPDPQWPTDDSTKNGADLEVIDETFNDSGHYITGVNVPLCFRRLEALQLHDASISWLAKIGDEVVLQINRQPMPWAPGPAGDFFLRFRGVNQSVFIWHSGETAELDDFDNEPEEGNHLWLYSGVTSISDGRCVYEIETLGGLIRIDSNSTAVDASPRLTRIDVHNLLSPLLGYEVLGFHIKYARPYLWLDFRSSDEETSLVVACDFEFCSLENGRSTNLDLDLIGVDGHDEQSLFEERTRQFRNKVAAGEIRVDAVDVIDDLGFYMKFNNGDSFQATLREESVSYSGAAGTWWAIHDRHRYSAQLVTPQP